jgi:hypothetical protein
MDNPNFEANVAASQAELCSTASIFALTSFSLNLCISLNAFAASLGSSSPFFESLMWIYEEINPRRSGLLGWDFNLPLACRIRTDLSNSCPLVS